MNPLPDTKQDLLCFECNSKLKKFYGTSDGEQYSFMCEEVYCLHYSERPLGVLLTKEEKERME
jgi:hypothetical protein